MGIEAPIPSVASEGRPREMQERPPGLRENLLEFLQGRRRLFHRDEAEKLAESALESPKPGDLPSALAFADKAVKADPTDVRAWSARAYARSFVGKNSEEVIADATRALEGDRDQAMLLVIRAGARLKTGDQERGEAQEGRPPRARPPMPRRASAWRPRATPCDP